jgi:hypothetical protein
MVLMNRRRFDTHSQGWIIEEKSGKSVRIGKEEEAVSSCGAGSFSSYYRWSIEDCCRPGLYLP